MLAPEFKVSLALLLDEGSFLVFRKSLLFSELLFLFISKLSSEHLSTSDRLLSVAKSVPVLSSAGLLSIQDYIFTAAGASP